MMAATTTDKTRATAALFTDGSARAEDLRLCERCRKGIVPCDGKCGFCGRRDATREGAAVVSEVLTETQGGGSCDL